MNTLFDVLDEHRTNKNDKRVFGLVLQGGAMRAVYTAGAIIPLIKYGFTNAFEHVIGSSAGAINGAYFLSEYLETKDAFIHDLASKNFVNLLRRDKKVDIDYCVDSVLRPIHPINVDALNSAHAKLHTIVTYARTGKKVVISEHHKFVEIYEEFRATAAMPLLYDKKVMLDGKYYIDGGVADLIPIDVAIKLGCTDIIVVMTQQASSYSFTRQHTRLVNHLVRKFSTNQSASIRRILPTNEKVLQANLRQLTHPLKKIRIYALEPTNEEMLISMATIDKLKIKELASLGISDMDKFLHRPLDN